MRTVKRNFRGPRLTPVLLTIAVALLLSGALTSCYWTPAAGTGAVSMTIPASMLAVRGVAGPTFSDESLTARVYLYRAGSATPSFATPIPFADGKDFKEQTLGLQASTLTIDELPVGPKYALLVVLGQYPADGNSDDQKIFVPQSYLISTDSFQLVAGGKTTISLSRADVPFTQAIVFGTTGISGIAVVKSADQTSTVYATDGATLYSGVDVKSLSPIGIPTSPKSDFSQYHINSLSVGMDSAGNQQLWLNTDHGIVPWTGTSFDTSFSSATYSHTDLTTQKTEQANTWNINVISSGAFLSGTDERAVFYQRTGGLGGVTATTSGPENWKWIDIDLGGIVPQNSQPVTSFAVWIKDAAARVGTAYFATKIGAFKVDQSLLSASIDSISEFLDSVTYFGVVARDKNLGVVSLGLDATKGTLYMGTSNGVYSYDASTIKGDLSELSPIAGTAGRNVTRVAVSPSGDYRAYLTGYNVFINSSNRGAAPPVQLPIFVSSLGVPNRLSVEDSGRLLVAGTGGLVSIDLSQLLK